MQINRIRLCNFRQHEHTDLELGAGLTGIIGPNGAGKTTILEAIAWAMYGMPAARGSRETIRRRGAPPRAKVEVEMEFSLGPHQYRVVRSLNGAELYQDGDPAPIANSLGAVTERVTRLLGMTREEFFNTYFTGQKELAVMAAMSAPERAQFLSRVLGYERLRAAQERLKERRASLRARLEALRAGLVDPSELDTAEQRARQRIAAAATAETATADTLAGAERLLLEVRPRWERVQVLRESALALDAELTVARHQVGAASDRVGRLERQMEEAALAAHNLEELTGRLAPLPDLRNEAATLGRQAEAWAARKGLLAQLSEVRTHLASVEERMDRIPTRAAVESSRERVNDLRASLTGLALDAEAARTAWVQDAQDARTKRQGLLDQYQELKDQRQRIVKAGPEGDCPTCTRPLGKEYGTVLQLLDRQIEEVVSNGNFYKQRIEQLQAEPRELEEVEHRRIEVERELSNAIAELGRLDAQTQEAGHLHEEHERLVLRTHELEASLGLLLGSYDQGRHEAVIGQIRELEPLALQAERLRGLVDRGSVVTAELETAHGERDAAAARQALLEGRLAELGYNEPMYRAAREAELTAEHGRREAELALVRARGESAAAAELIAEIARRRAERVEREREAAATAAELALHQELDRALTDLRTDLNAALRPDLSELASGFLRDLTNGRYTDLELDEDYVATLLDDGEAKAVISGGEEDVANLALRLAISQMIAERAGQPLSLLVLDEIFGSLDEERRASVVDLLRSLADRFPQVILITHIDSVREGFDRVVRVGFDLASGVATVREDPLGGHDVAA
ncbi:MAG TPA: SMC family ATPase [Gemmatimonadales bacterium]|nr:SMC family ATPase [Gemmatimonadales bacterium]